MSLKFYTEATLMNSGNT